MKKLPKLFGGFFVFFNKIKLILYKITLSMMCTPKVRLFWKVNEKLDTELREFKNYIFQSLLETCNQDLNAS
ncbi:MAG: hypothetical protein E7E27_11115, partial [Lactococcus lactis]|nr:hypothetical protein [Lactococcus lactis]